MAVKIDEVLAPDWWSWCLLVAGNTAPRLRVANLQGETDHQFPVTTRTIQRSKARRALWPFGCGPCGACCLGSRRRCTNCHRPAECRCRCLKNRNCTVSVAQWRQPVGRTAAHRRPPPAAPPAHPAPPAPPERGGLSPSWLGRRSGWSPPPMRCAGSGCEQPPAWCQHRFVLQLRRRAAEGCSRACKGGRAGGRTRDAGARRSCRE